MNTNATEKNLTHRDFKNRVDTVCDKYNTKSAIVALHNDDSKTINTFGELRKGAIKLKKILDELGISRGERIAVLSPHSPYAAACVIQLAYIGITTVLLDAGLPISELSKWIAFSDLSGVIIVEELYNRFEIQTFYSINVVELCKTENKYRVIKKAENKTITVSFDESVIAICFSSGTTATMKGVMLTYHSILIACEYLQRFTKLDDSRKFFNVLPVSHIAGYSVGMSCILTGCEMGFVDKVDSVGLQRGFQNYQPTNFIMIPKVYEIIRNNFLDKLSNKSFVIRNYFNVVCKMARKMHLPNKIIRMLLHPFLKAVFGKKMIICGCGTASCSPHLVAFYQNLGLEFVNVYGCTECGMPIAAVNRKERFFDAGVGSIKQFSEINIKIASPDSNGIGEVLVKTPLIMKGYFRELSLTKKAFENDYFKTGDNGYIDKKGYLHITGRIKDCIILQSGIKLSPEEVDNFYQTVCPNVLIASCSVADDNCTDEIHICIETTDKPKDIIDMAVAAIKRKSLESGSIYSLAGIHTIDRIPVTSVGKIKRYLLKEKIEKSEGLEPCDEELPLGNASIEEIVTSIITKYSKLGTKITLESKLSDDLGLDSLSFFEVISEISSKTSADVFETLCDVKTVGELIDVANNINHGVHELDLSVFPHTKTDKDIKSLRRWIKAMRKFYNFEVIGAENIPQNDNFILCSNHINNLDPIWLLAAMGETNYHKIGCLAAVHLYQNKRTRSLFNMIGAIPVDRSGNTAPALKRCTECLIEGYSLIIFPEGARTRDGRMLPFKNGAAELSVKTGKPIIPARIDGGFDIFPRGKKIPRVFDFKKMCKFTLKITFGDPIYPNNNNVQEITDMLKDQIEKK